MNSNDLVGVIADIEKKFGKGALVNFEDKQENIKRIKSGSISLDIALGGGYPVGRIIEIYGPESSGKSTLALHAVAEVQRNGGTAAYIDAEHAFDPIYAEKLGVNLSKTCFLFNQPDSGEQGLDIADLLVRSGKIDIIIIDSVAALTPRAEIDGEMGDSKMGLQARLMSQAMRKMVANVGRNNTIVLFINQLRDKIGVMFGNPEVTTGGNALKFYASQRLDIRRISQNKDKDNEIVANKVRVKVVKNKVAPPHRQAEFEIKFGVGIDKIIEIIDLAVQLEIIKKSGSWFSYENSKLGQGVDNVRQTLIDNPDLYEIIEKEVKECIYED